MVANTIENVFVKICHINTDHRIDRTPLELLNSKPNTHNAKMWILN